jgi:hypothetical protein
VKKKPVDLEKVKKALPTGWAEEADAMDVDALKGVIVECAANESRLKRERDGDEKLAGAKEIVKDIGGGYSEAIKTQQAKTAYSLHLLEQKGDVAVGEALDG